MFLFLFPNTTIPPSPKIPLSNIQKTLKIKLLFKYNIMIFIDMNITPLYLKHSVYDTFK